MSMCALKIFFAGAFLRWLLMASNFAPTIRNRVEVSTPLNSWKRVQEGAYLYENGIDPYSGDLYHENPLILYTTNWLIKHAARFIPSLFILCDLVCAWLLYSMGKRFTAEMLREEQQNVARFAKNTAKLQIKTSDVIDVPLLILIAYLFNPYAIFNCVAQTTTVWSNVFLAAFFYLLSRKQMLLSCVALALETQRNFYPILLIVPAALYFDQCDTRNETRKPETDDSDEKMINSWNQILRVVVTFLSTLGCLHYIAYAVTENWNFLDATYGFILNHRDLQPNIGLFWYFFTEMFEHFRTLFLIAFQMNATILYLVPLTIKLHKQPIFLATIIVALSAIFRSYPCVGDIAFYLALFPLWKESLKLMSNYFVVVCVFVVTTALGPTVWYLWIYCNSANANFYFGATLAFASAQIFLVTDLLFASNKRDFCLRNDVQQLTQLVLE